MTARNWKILWTLAGVLALTIVLYSWWQQPQRASDAFTRPGSILVLTLALIALPAMAAVPAAQRRWRRITTAVVVVLAAGVETVALDRLSSSDGPVDSTAGWVLSFVSVAMIGSALYTAKTATIPPEGTFRHQEAQKEYGGAGSSLRRARARRRGASTVRTARTARTARAVHSRGCG